LITSDREEDVILGHSLQPFQGSAETYDIDLQVKWVPDLSPIPAPQLFDSGNTWRLYRDQGAFRFDIGYPLPETRPFKRLFVNSNFRREIVQMSEGFFADFPDAARPLAYPLDELLIMHRLTQEKAIELHGTGIVRQNGVANLFVGHSGAGKSTTTRLWTDIEDVEVLSDDRIIVRRDEQQQIPRFSRNDNGNENSSCRNDRKMRMYGTPWHGEAMFASPNSAPLTRIFVLEHGHGNVITRLSPSQAVAELFARSFVPFHRHEYVDSALVFLEELVGSVPVYRYSFEPDQRAVDKIRHFND
jgi:hypothetical protein